MRLRASLLLGRHGPACLQANLDRALHSWPVSWIQFCGAGRINPAKNAVEMFGAPLLANLVYAAAQFFVSLRTREKGPAQGTEVEASTPDKKWNLAAAFDVVNFSYCFARPVA